MIHCCTVSCNKINMILLAVCFCSIGLFEFGQAEGFALRFRSFSLPVSRQLAMARLAKISSVLILATLVDRDIVML